MTASARASLDTPAGYTPFDEAGLRAFLAARHDLARRLGGEAGAWRIREVGDGNLNVVYIVEGPAGGLCVKQSLPYVRAAGEGWPMPLDRTAYEHAYWQRVAAHVDGLAPRIFHFDAANFVIVMELLELHVILRRGLIDGQRYPSMASTVAEYVARTAVLTSDLVMPLEQKFDGVAAFAGNNALRRITADLVFADPYRGSPRSRWTSPDLDDLAAAFRSDIEVKMAVARLGHRFLSSTESLLHGDLHTGSVMVTATDTRIIDAEFATYGPTAFDVGVFIGNLLMNWFAQPGHAEPDDDRRSHADWVLAQAGEFWHHFADRYATLWRSHAGGDAYPIGMFDERSDVPAMDAVRRRALATLFAEAVGFAGAEIVRRILGFAHNADFESIENPRRRAIHERAALLFARELLTRPERFDSIERVIDAARQAAAEPRCRRNDSA